MTASYEDHEGNIWFGTLRNLNEYADGKTNTFTSVAYGKSDVMLNIECNGGHSPAGFRAANGKFWFPTHDGVMMIDSEKVAVNQKPPPVVIESLKIDNREIDVESQGRKTETASHIRNDNPKSRQKGVG